MQNAILNKMFTGIIEHLGSLESFSLQSDGGRVTIHAPTLASKLAVSNSIAVNGCCLTIISVDKDRFSADLSGETIRKTSFGANSGALKKGARVNLEQPLTAGKEFGGHFVLGHVDGTGRVAHLRPEGESWWYGVQIPEELFRWKTCPGGKNYSPKRKLPSRAVFAGPAAEPAFIFAIRTVTSSNSPRPECGRFVR